MAVEDTDKISSGIQPVSQVRYTPKKGMSEVSGDSVSSPAVSVEDSTVEKKASKQIHSDDNSGTKTQEVVSKEVLTRSKLEEITEGINQELSFFSNSVQFRIEEVESDDSGLPKLGQGEKSYSSSLGSTKKEIVVSVVDKRTGEVIRKIPPEDLLQSLYNASMFLGLIIDQIV
jgi:uncharacterized FlaG/YvyC family protein